MRRMRLSLFAILVLAVFAMLLAGCGRKGLININGEKIAKDEFYARLERVPVQTVKAGKPVTIPAGQYVIEQVITERLLQQLAKKENCEATPEQVERKLNYLKRSTGGNFLAQLKQQGITKQDWERQMMLQQSVVNLLEKDVKVSDEEVRRSYDEQIGRKPNPFSRSESVHISVIITKEREKIDKAYKLLQDRQDFGTVALQLSEDKTTAPYQGSVGWLSMDMEVVPLQIRQTAFNTPVGKFAQPIYVKDKADAAWVIVKVDNKRKASTEKFDDVKELIKEQLAVKKADRKPFDKMLQKFISDSKIQVNAERYKNIPEMMKTNAGVPSELEPKLPTDEPAKP